MLLRLAVTNHASLHVRQEFSLISTALKDAECGLFEVPFLQHQKVLPCAVVYGANAAGKSNLVDAISFLRKAVRLSHKEGNPKGGVPSRPFRLRGDPAKSVTAFDIDFISDGVRFHYGFKCNRTEFLEEWLYSFPTGRRQILFERSAPDSISFGRALKGRNRVIADLMRNNSLFLSAAMQNGHKELTSVGAFFESIVLNRTIAVAGGAISQTFEHLEVGQDTIDFLRRMGTGITGFRKQKKEHKPEVLSMQRDFMDVFSKYAPERSALKIETMYNTVELSHQGHNGKDVFFKPEMESAGTRRLLVLVSQAYSALAAGSLFIVDELDASLHTQACEALVSLFVNPQINKKGAQLIATTHDTNLMLSKALRRDQVWFSEKDSDGATHIFPLSDFQTRRSDNIERGYLQGRFGAIPFSGSASDLFGDC